MTFDLVGYFLTFRFRLVPTLVVLPTLIVLLLLGNWQMARLDWKIQLIEKIRIRSAAPPVTSIKMVEALDEKEFRKVEVFGQFLKNKKLYLLNQYSRGHLGFYLFAPLKLSQSSEYVFVNLGWVAKKFIDSGRHVVDISGNNLNVSGTIRIPGAKGYFVPENEPTKNQWFYVNLQEMATALGIYPVKPYYIVSGIKLAQSKFPIPAKPTVKLENNHLSYAITWYSLAFSLAVIYFMISINRKPKSLR